MPFFLVIHQGRAAHVLERAIEQRYATASALRAIEPAEITPR
jgi:hypothetical protein